MVAQDILSYREFDIRAGLIRTLALPKTDRDRFGLVPWGCTALSYGGDAQAKAPLRGLLHSDLAVLLGHYAIATT
jgi:hypothetical protein